MANFSYDTIVLGAGAAGMMAAATAGSGGKSVLVLDHAKSAGEKIRISGGGRCNFTNLNTEPKNFLSQNLHFAKSALKRYSQHDFIALVERHGIAYHEKTLGQLFCDQSAKQIIDMLLAEMAKVSAELWLKTSLISVTKSESGFSVEVEKSGTRSKISCINFVVACGGKSIPKMGASSLGYQLAEQFNHPLTETRPALVPLIFGDDVMPKLRALAGVAVNARVSCDKTQFDEAMLFTHRGLSGPSILQISSYWQEKASIKISMLPDIDVLDALKTARRDHPKRTIGNHLGQLLPKRLAADLLDWSKISGNLADLSDKKLQLLTNMINYWQLTPIGSEGYRTAEVTLGGVDTNGLNSKTIESKHISGLYFIGEVVDVTGWLGGYNFQWAWSSGWAAGTAIAQK